MSRVTPAFTSRTNDPLVARRLMSQLQFNQGDLLRIQTQVSSGRQFSIPSENAPAAVRAGSLQRLIERKEQIEVNLNVGQSYLTAADQALGSVSKVLAEIRAASLVALNTTTTESERQAVAEQAQRALEQLVTLGNRQYRGRYLFGGSQANSEPFAPRGAYVEYQGNEGTVRSFSDIDRLFTTNIHGDDVFGAISPQVLGTSDLNPRLTLQTRLADLRGGDGIRLGSFSVSDGTNSSTIDIGSAETLGDVIQLLEDNPPLNRTVSVSLNSNGITVALDATGGGNLTIREVGGGSTAAELGIFEPEGNGTTPIVGDDLNPRLTRTTRLDDILGVRASAKLVLSGSNNDLRVEAVSRGPTLNNVQVAFVDDDRLQAGPGITAGNEFATYHATASAAKAALSFAGADNDLLLTAVAPGVAQNDIAVIIDASGNLGNSASTSYNASTKIFTIQIDDNNETTLDQVVQAINASGVFAAAPDGSAGEGFNPSSVIQSSDGGVVNATSAGGVEADTLLFHIDPGSTSANDLIAAVENNPSISALFRLSLTAEDSPDPAKVGIGKIGLGVTGSLSGGSGLEFDQDSGIQIKNGEQTYVLSFADAETVEDVLNVLNTSPAGVLAQLNATGSGIDVRSRVSGATFGIGENGGQTATHLGLRSFSEATTLAELNFGSGVQHAVGVDFTIRRSDGVDLQIDVSSAATVGDVISSINAHPDNVASTTRVVAQLAASGNGLVLTEVNPGVANPLTVTRAAGSHAAWGLGLLPPGTNSISGATIEATDANPLETQSVFNSLVRLVDSLHANEGTEIRRAINLLDEDLDRVNFARAELGAREQNVAVLQDRLQDEQVELKRSLSAEIDVDLVEAISQLTQKQAAFQAALQSMANIAQLSLLDYL